MPSPLTLADLARQGTLLLVWCRCGHLLPVGPKIAGASVLALARRLMQQKWEPPAQAERSTGGINMLFRTPLLRPVAASFALIALAATAATAADITVTSAKIAAGKLVITGTTAAANTRLRLDGQSSANFNVRSGRDRKFRFSLAYHPGDCIVTLEKATASGAPGASADLVVADCAPSGISSRGAWSAAAPYGANDLVTHQGSSWLAKRRNVNKQPADGSDWELFAAKGETGPEGPAGETGPAGPPGAAGWAGALVDPLAPPSGPAGGDLAGTYPNPTIRNLAVTTPKIGNLAVNNSKIANLSVTRGKIATGAVNNPKIADGAVTSAKVLDDTVVGGGLAAVDLAADSVGSSEIVAASVGSSEIASGAVGADELRAPHEHLGPVTNITDVTAHDGNSETSSSTVTCGLGEHLLSVSVDWTNTGGHNETYFGGVQVINRSANPDFATVRVAYDGGATTASYQAVATCIF